MSWLFDIVGSVKPVAAVTSAVALTGTPITLNSRGGAPGPIAQVAVEPEGLQPEPRCTRRPPSTFTVIVEVVFKWPGVGELVVDALSRRDFPLIQATVLVTVVLALLVQLLVDLLYPLIDPRVRLGQEAR